MAQRAPIEPPRALAAVLDLAVALARQAPSSRVAIARAGGALDPATLPPRLAAAVERELAAAREAVCVALAARDVERQLQAAWGRPPARVLDELDPEPLAVTPTGQVHRAELDGVAVAVKLRRPGLERQLRADLALLDALGPALGAAFPRLDASAVLRDAREQALDELDLEHEAGQQRRIARALRGVEGVTVPRVHLELAAPDVLVADLAAGETLAAGARPADGAAAARALAAAFRAAVLDAGLAPVDPRPSHVVVAPDGTLALLGLGVARPVDRERARRALDGLTALTGDEPAAFAAVAAGHGVLDDDAARAAHPLLRAVAGPLLGAEPAALDAAALAALLARAWEAGPELAVLACRAAPLPEDLALARMLGQLTALMARLEATERWGELVAR
jgi:predicted unusual protein kinase regulating ubiquinone biosynthesis (AarF/ABC1/UbiB family)